jgi:TRAP-type uncharacterized transport system substrate-binding protein
MAPGLKGTELVKKLWLWRWFRRGRSTESSPQRGSTASPRNRFLSAAKDLDLDTLETLMNRRLRRILRHTGIVVTFLTLLVIGLTALAIYMTSTPTVMKIAVGPPGSEDVRFVEKLTEKFERDKAAFRLAPVVTDHPVDMMDSDEIPDYDLAVIAGNPAMTADWPVVTILRQNVMLLLVPAPGTRGPPKDRRAKVPTIAKVADLAGNRVGIVARSAASPDLLQVVLKHYGIPSEKVQTLTIEPANLKAAIRDRTVDVILVAGPAGGQVIADTIAATSDVKRGPTFIEIEQAEAIAARVPAYVKFEIVAGAFGGTPPRPAEAIDSLSFPQYLVASKSLSEVKIAAFSKLIYTSRPAINFEMPGVIKIETPSTDKDATVLVHPGTDAYLSDNQKTFFDRWGDQIFYGLLIFPILGSAIAGVMGYVRGEKGNRRIRLLHHMLQLIKRARTAETIEALDEIQTEIDHILVTMIQQVERNQLDETGLMLSATAIEQAHHAISDRRAMLLDHPERVQHSAVVQPLPTVQQVANR